MLFGKLVVRQRLLDPPLNELRRSITLRQGDALDADLSITQRFLAEANVWENFEYTVTKVYSVKLGETQTTMDFSHYGVSANPPTQDKSKH